jgi:hypothetical protein
MLLKLIRHYFGEHIYRIIKREAKSLSFLNLALAALTSGRSKLYFKNPRGGKTPASTAFNAKEGISRTTTAKTAIFR